MNFITVLKREASLEQVCDQGKTFIVGQDEAKDESTGVHYDKARSRETVAVNL